MFHKGSYILVHQCRDTLSYPADKKKVRNPWELCDELKCNQRNQLGYLHMAPVLWLHNLILA